MPVRPCIALLGGRGAVERRRVRGVDAEQAAFVLAGDVRHARRRIEHADQALREHADQARRQQERLDAHVAQARDGADGRVRVQRRHHEVARQARLHGDLGRLEVADLADHHDVGVLAQDRAQAARERHLDLRVDLRLADAVDVILDRILDGQDVAREVVDALERRVQRRRLAGAGRAGDEQDAVRPMDELVHRGLVAVGHAEARQREPARLLVEQAQHDALAVPRRDRRDAHVDGAARDPQRDAAVLRQALLGDVELRHDLDARHDERRDGALRLQHLAQHAVDAKPHRHAVLVRLDVNVGRVVLDGLRQERVDEANDRRLVVAVDQVRRLGQLLRDGEQVRVVVQALRPSSSRRRFRRRSAAWRRTSRRRPRRSAPACPRSAAPRRGSAPRRRFCRWLPPFRRASSWISTPWRFANANGKFR